MENIKEILKAEETAAKLLADAEKRSEAIIADAKKEAIVKTEELRKKQLEKREAELHTAREQAKKAKEQILAKAHAEIKEVEARHKANRDSTVRYIVEALTKNA